MALEHISDQELLERLVQVDARLLKEGQPIKQRAMNVPIEVMREYGFEHVPIVVAGFGKGGDFQRLNDMFHKFYRKQDTAMGGHIGVFMYRDIFAIVGVPHVYGQRSINLIECVELSDLQKIAIQSEPEILNAMLDQVIDICDVQYGVPEVRKPFRDNVSAFRFITLAQLNLHAASAVLTGGYDHRGAVQSALLASELALKAGAAYSGLSEQRLLREPFGHCRKKVLEAAKIGLPGLDEQRIARTLDRQPDYVKNRYTFDQPPRRKAGHLVMGAQYITAEVVRQMSDRNARADLSSSLSRSYPA
ncbi:MAG: hypothetical protein FP826_15560 [Sphingomonadales bacterium]|nr:hypothetical protein [Sphingomonadales bacterium]